MIFNDPVFSNPFTELGVIGALIGLLLALGAISTREFFKWLGSKRSTPDHVQTEDRRAEDKRLDELLLASHATAELLRDFLVRRDEQWKFLYDAVTRIRSEDIEMIRGRLHDIASALTAVQGDVQLNRDQRKEIAELLSKVEQYLVRRR